jgi:S-adenosylmethionine-diacylglycerol 3-amino-3-carboxypropyl transferase
MQSRFHRTLNYASVNEDWRTEAAALRIGSTDTVLCVTGSGDRPLDLLALDPGRVVAIDLNPAQNHLLVLKMAAMQQLAYEPYAAFLGLTAAPGSWRWEVWRGLRRELPPTSRTFWQERERMMRAGVIYQGRWERFYRRRALLARVLRPRAIPALFEFDTLEEQRTFVRDHWDARVWRAAYATVCSPLASRLLLRDPAYYAHVAVPVAQVLYRRMRASLDLYLARENFMVSLVLLGRLPEADLPPYLTPAGHALISPRLERLQVVTADLTEYLATQPKGAFTRFSLSDVPSFLPASGFERLLGGVIQRAAPGARVVLRQFLTRYAPAAHHAARLAREPELETRLALEARASAYEFLVAEVDGA